MSLLKHLEARHKPDYQMWDSKRPSILFDPDPDGARQIISHPIEFSKAYLDEASTADSFDPYLLSCLILDNEAISMAGERYHGLNTWETLLFYEHMPPAWGWSMEQYKSAVDSLIDYGFEFVLLWADDPGNYLVRLPTTFHVGCSMKNGPKPTFKNPNIEEMTNDE